MPVILLYWFAAQEETSTCTREKSSSFYAKFSLKYNEVTPGFLNQEEGA